MKHSNIKNIQNVRFGKLVAIEPTHRRYNNSVVWRCICDCGKEAFVPTYLLCSGNTKSCGCLKPGGPPKDLRNQRFGKLIALEPTEQRERNAVMWRCICDCGNEKIVSGRLLTAGKIKSCGCLKSGNTMNLTNMRFGKLTAKYPMQERSGHAIIWHCECDCGKTIDVRANSLHQGTVKSCGCLNVSKNQSAFKGKRFGRLVAIEPTEKRQNGKYTIWRCICDCGNEVEVSTRTLRLGKKKSCGCLVLERRKRQATEILDLDSLESLP